MWTLEVLAKAFRMPKCIEKKVVFSSNTINS